MLHPNRVFTSTLKFGPCVSYPKGKTETCTMRVVVTQTLLAELKNNDFFGQVF